MTFSRFQDFLSGLVSRQRGLFFTNNEAASIDELLEKLMGTVGEVSGIVLRDRCSIITLISMKLKS